MGFDGNDTLIGGAGGDVLDGGDGKDTASYSTASAGLFAGLEEPGFNSGDALGDSYISIENLIGSAFDDFLYGSLVDNRLSGGAGNDTLVGKGGADTFDGGTGSDKVSFDASPAVRADLLLPSTNTGDAIGDIYISIENLDGSAFNDTLLGDNNANIIRGSSYPNLASGDDQLFGRGGNDSLDGHDGNDRLDGGAALISCPGVPATISTWWIMPAMRWSRCRAAAPTLFMPVSIMPWLQGRRSRFYGPMRAQLV